jgi:hypothetical protein
VPLVLDRDFSIRGWQQWAVGGFGLLQLVRCIRTARVKAHRLPERGEASE